jgi:hypothetical protein
VRIVVGLHANRPICHRDGGERRRARWPGARVATTRTGSAMMDKESYPGAKSTLQCVLPFRAQRHALPSSKRQPLFLSFISVVVPPASAKTFSSRKMAFHSSGVHGDGGAGRLLSWADTRAASQCRACGPADRSIHLHTDKSYQTCRYNMCQLLI